MDLKSSVHNIKLNNKGFSMIELIVIVVIMAIVSGGALTSFLVVRNADVSAATDKLAYMLANTRKLSIAREEGTVKMAIEFDGSTYYARIYYTENGTDWTEHSEEKLGGSSLKFTIEREGEGVHGSPIVMSELHNNEVEFNFKKSNGSLNEKYKKIIIEGSKTRNITVIRETGRCIAD